MNDAAVRAAGARIAAAGHVLVVAHKRPDGDALGSLLGLGLALESAGKRVTLVDADGCPAAFRFLPGYKKIQNHFVGECDLMIALDTAEPGRLGLTGPLAERPVDIVVDHHLTNGGFGAINLIDPAASSTSEVLLTLLEPWGLSLTPDVAVCLLTGLLTDTLGFRTSNTAPRTLEAALTLMRAGAPLPELLQRSLYSRTLLAVRLWGTGLSNLQLEGNLVHTSLSLADKQALGYTGRDDADLVNMLTTIEEADVAVIFVEQTPSFSKVSWRATPGIDITPVALRFGGGGHAASAGAEIKGTLAEVRERVLEVTKSYLQNGSVTSDE